MGTVAEHRGNPALWLPNPHRPMRNPERPWKQLLTDYVKPGGFAVKTEPTPEARTIIRTMKDRHNPYVMIRKTIFEEPNISWKAKGIIAYVLSRPDDWQIWVADLVKRSTDGRDAVYTGLKELKENGYLRESIYRDQHGRISYREYVIYENPDDAPLDPENPDQVKGQQNSLDPENPDQVNPDQENPRQLSTDIYQERKKTHTAENVCEDFRSQDKNQKRHHPPTVSDRSWAAWLHGYGDTRVNEVAAWAEEVQPNNPAGWMKKCLEEEWPKPPKLAQHERKQESLQRERREREADAREEQRLADIRDHEVGEVMGWWYALTADDQDKLRGQIDGQTLRNKGLNDMVAKAALMSLLRGGHEAPGITWLRVAKAVWEQEHGQWLSLTDTTR